MDSDSRPKVERTEGGRKIVYPIWRDDLAEATIFPIDREVSVPDKEPPRSDRS